MRWVAALGTFVILYGLLVFANFGWLIPVYGVNAATLICLAAGLVIGWVCVMVWLAVDLWERGY